MPAPITAMDVSDKLILDDFQQEDQLPYAMKFARATTRLGNNEPVREMIRNGFMINIGTGLILVVLYYIFLPLMQLGWQFT